MHLYLICFKVTVCCAAWHCVQSLSVHSWLHIAWQNWHWLCAILCHIWHIWCRLLWFVIDGLYSSMGRWCCTLSNDKGWWLLQSIVLGYKFGYITFCVVSLWVWWKTATYVASYSAHTFSMRRPQCSCGTWYCLLCNMQLGHEIMKLLYNTQCQCYINYICGSLWNASWAVHRQRCKYTIVNCIETVGFLWDGGLMLHCTLVGFDVYTSLSVLSICYPTV